MEGKQEILNSVIQFGIIIATKVGSTLQIEDKSASSFSTALVQQQEKYDYSVTSASRSL
jgi:hypothetical protein